MSKQKTIVKFFPEKHQYIDNLGRMYVSVTQLLKQEFPFDQDAILEDITKNPRSKYYKRDKNSILEEWSMISVYGNLVHKTIENYVNLKEEPTKDSITWGCFKQFQELGFEQCKSEVLLFNVPLLIAGTADLIVERDNHYEIWDIKTSNKIDQSKLLQYSMQLNMYKFFAKSVLDKPVHVGGIIHFIDFFNNKENTKMTIVKPINCSNEVKNVFEKRQNHVRLSNLV